MSSSALTPGEDLFLMGRIRLDINIVCYEHPEVFSPLVHTRSEMHLHLPDYRPDAGLDKGLLPFWLSSSLTLNRDRAYVDVQFNVSMRRDSSVVSSELEAKEMRYQELPLRDKFQPTLEKVKVYFWLAHVEAVKLYNRLLNERKDALSVDQAIDRRLRWTYSKCEGCGDPYPHVATEPAPKLCNTCVMTKLGVQTTAAAAACPPGCPQCELEVDIKKEVPRTCRCGAVLRPRQNDGGSAWCSECETMSFPPETHSPVIANLQGIEQVEFT